MNNNIKISAHDMKNILNSTDEQLNKAISYVKEHGFEIDDNTFRGIFSIFVSMHLSCLFT